MLGVNVEVKIFSNKEMLSDPTTPIEEWDHSRYITIEDDYPVEDMEFDTYQETPELIKVVKNEVGTVRYHSALLKSNCRVTSTLLCI